MNVTDPEQIRTAVRERYAQAARSAQCCGPRESGPQPLGPGLYRAEDEAGVPGAALAASLGCGNPTMLADLQPGQVVLDLGSGGGIDVLLSARRVGPNGRAYGLDMTPEMLELARRNQLEAGVSNVEFLHGTIEAIPLPDDSVDVIISNCVINLSADKDAVLREAFRVLKPGGRLAVSDIVLRRPLPEPVAGLMAAWTGCMAGALLDTDYQAKLGAAGFQAIEIEATQVYDSEDARRAIDDLSAGGTLEGIGDGAEREAAIAELDGAVTSSFVRASKPVR